MTVITMMTGTTGAVALLLIAMGSNMNLYFELSAIQNDNTLIGKTIRIGGIVKKNSIQRQQGNLKVRFVLTDMTHSVTVDYEGVLPDLFREGQGVLVKGILNDKNSFTAINLLAKHDENYLPQEVKESLEAQGVDTETLVEQQ